MWLAILEAHLDLLRELYPRRKSATRPALKLRQVWESRPRLHTLEDRLVPAGSVTLFHGVLTITGTTGNDTVSVRQISGSEDDDGDNDTDLIVTLNGHRYSFDVQDDNLGHDQLVQSIQANLLGGNDTITLDESSDKITPPSNVVGGDGSDTLIYKGTAGADSITVTSSTVALTGAGLLTYSGFESLRVSSLAGNDTVTVTGVKTGTTTALEGGPDSDTFAGNFPENFAGNVSLSGFETASLQVPGTFSGTLTGTATPFSGVSIGKLSGRLTAAGGSVANATINSITPSGLLEVTEVPPGPGAGLLSSSTFGTVSGRVQVGAMVDVQFGTIDVGAVITASGQGTTSDVSIGMLSGSLSAPEDGNAGSGVMSHTTIGTVTSTGSVSTGSISGMMVGTSEGSITASGQGTTSDVSIGMLSGSLSAPEDGNAGSGVMSHTTIGTVTSTGSVSTGSISGMMVGTSEGSITASGQGTTDGVSIGTLSGSLNAPEDNNAGSGVMSHTTIGTVTSTGSVSTGSISGMMVGTSEGSIIAAGAGTITDITIDLLTGLVYAQQDLNDGSGVINTAQIGTLGADGTFKADSTITGLTIGNIQGGHLSAGHFDTLSAQGITVPSFQLVESGITRTIAATPVPGFSGPASFAFFYDNSGSGNPVVSVQVDATGVSNARYDLSLTTDTVARLARPSIWAGFTRWARGSSAMWWSAEISSQAQQTPVSSACPRTRPVAFSCHWMTWVAWPSLGTYRRSIVAKSASAVAFGFANGVTAANANLFDAGRLFSTSTRLVQANDTFPAFAGDGTPVAMFIATVPVLNLFDFRKLLFTDQAADSRPVTAAVTVVDCGLISDVTQINLTGEAVGLSTLQPIDNAITVGGNGSLGDLTLLSLQNTPDITAPRIVGSLTLNGRINSTIQTTQGDLGRAITNSAGVITRVTSISANLGIGDHGKIISAGNLVSSINVNWGMDGVIAAQGDIGVIQTDGSGKAVVGTGASKPLTRFGGVNVTGGTDGTIVALGNIFGDISTNGGLDGRIAAKGQEEFGLGFRNGILGNININGGIRSGAAIVSGGLIGDDGNNNIGNDSVGTKLNDNGAIKGILAAERDINISANGSINQAGYFENVADPAAAKYAAGANKAAIDAIFTGDLSTTLSNLGKLHVGTDGNLTIL